MAIGFVLFYIYYTELIQQVDVMTALLNRRSYETDLKFLQRPSKILLFDVDSFKEVNDCYGHEYGDFCLALIGRLLKESYVHSGMCYRIGGDEFCVILNNPDSEASDHIDIFQEKLNNIRITEPNMPTVSVVYTTFLTKK